MLLLNEILCDLQWERQTVFLTLWDRFSVFSHAILTTDYCGLRQGKQRQRPLNIVEVGPNIQGWDTCTSYSRLEAIERMGEQEFWKV